MNEFTEHFTTSLLLQAQLLAYREKADVVLSKHVNEARNLIDRKERQARSQQLLIVFGGALFGASAQGFITELSVGNQLLIGIFAVLGFIGTLLVFLGFRK